MAGLCTIDNMAVDENLTVSGERKGAKVNVMFTDSSSGITGQLKAGQVTTAIGKKAVIGWVTPRAGSITGVSVSYEVTASDVTPSVLSIGIGGAIRVTLDMPAASVAKGFKEKVTQDRGTDKFSQGAKISASFAGTATLTDLIVTIEMILDL